MIETKGIMRPTAVEAESLKLISEGCNLKAKEEKYVSKDIIGEISKTHRAIQTLEKTISNLEMELPAARVAQESLLTGSPLSEDGSKVGSYRKRKYLMVIGINTTFSSRKRRDSVCATWMPQGEKRKNLKEARNVLDEMPERNVVSWTAMISAYSKKGYAYDALDLFLQMLRSVTEPNEFTFATVLSSCTGTFGFELGRQIHSLIIKRTLDTHIFVGSSLLDMYAKAGRIREAREVFESMPEKDVVSCTAIISDYAQLGLDAEALEIFRRLNSEGMGSNYVTYASVLTALSGLAALDLGKQVHNHVLRGEKRKKLEDEKGIIAGFVIGHRSTSFAGNN